jgi:hypothetical protein
MLLDIEGQKVLKVIVCDEEVAVTFAILDTVSLSPHLPLRELGNAWVKWNAEGRHG